MMLTLFSVLASLVLASEFYSSDIFPKPKYEIETKVLSDIDWNDNTFTWYDFFFGEGGTLAYTNFLINSRGPYAIKLQDCFCEGDVFQLFAFDTPILITDQNCNYPNQDTTACNYFSDDLTTCINDGQHCTNSVSVFNFGPTFNNVTIKVLQSPLQFGRAYIGFKLISS